MATRLTYTTGSRSAELDRAFEAALADARERDAEPLAHLVGGRDVSAGDRFEREDPSRREHVASRSHEGAELVGEAVESARAAQREWRRPSDAGGVPAPPPARGPLPGTQAPRPGGGQPGGGGG